MASDALTEERLRSIETATQFRSDNDARDLGLLVAELRRLRALVEQATVYEGDDWKVRQRFDGDWLAEVEGKGGRLVAVEGHHAMKEEAFAAVERWRASKGENRG